MIDTTKHFAVIFLKLHQMNRRSFIYKLAKLTTKVTKSKQGTAKSLAYL